MLIFNFDTMTLLFVFVFIEFVVFTYWGHRNDPLPKRDSKCIWKAKVKKLVKVYDGDTFTAFVEGHNPITGKPVNIRIRGIDTPELKSSEPHIKEKAERAKALAVKILTNSNKIILYNVSLEDKYGRMLATVFCDGTDLAQLLLNRQLAKSYDGKTKQIWS